MSRRAAAHRRQRPARLTGSEREHDRQSPTSVRRAKSRQARQRAGRPAMLTAQAKQSGQPPTDQPACAQPAQRRPDHNRSIPSPAAGAGLDGAAAGGWPDAVQRAAYRTVQEALTNITKHAPGARVTVQVIPWRRGLRVAVGNGPPPGQPSSGLPGGGHGLIGLRERAELLGGTLRAEPTPDGGYLLEATLPAAPHGELTSPPIAPHS